MSVTPILPHDMPTLFRDEEWRQIPASRYLVSSYGRVASPTGHVLVTRAHPRTGHLDVKVRQSGALKTRLVHHLVLETFVGPRPPGMIARHLNDVPNDNRPANLAWGTYTENARDSVVNGGNANTRKSHCPRGHELSDRNTTPSSRAVGRRRCLACNRERSLARYHGRVFSASNADAYYEQIVGVSA